MSEKQGATSPAPQRSDSDDWPGLAHYYCCDEDTALCGADLSGFENGEGSAPPEDECVVCADLERYPCERCGEW